LPRAERDDDVRRRGRGAGGRFHDRLERREPWRRPDVFRERAGHGQDDGTHVNVIPVGSVTSAQGTTNTNAAPRR